MFNDAMLNVVTYLESLDDVSNVDLKLLGEGSVIDINTWERKNLPYKIPNDMKGMYTLFNGFELKWKAIVGSQTLEIGHLCVNKMDKITRIPLDGQFMPSTTSSNYESVDTEGSTGFLLDSHPMCGQIVLVYCSRSRDTAGQPQVQFDHPEVWLQDNSLRWHFIASTFTQFCRLMVVHLGIVGWPLAFTPEGLSPVTTQWMNIYCKERLILDLHWQKKVQSPPVIVSPPITGVNIRGHTAKHTVSPSSTPVRKLNTEFLKADSASKMDIDGIQ